MSDRTTTPMDMLRGMPRSDDAERGMLSCLMVDRPEVLEAARMTIPEECFYHVGNRLLYTEMHAANAAGVPLDPQALSQWLIDRGNIDKIGGPATIAEIYNFTPTPAHFPHFRQILLQKLKLRSIIAACTEGIQLAFETGEGDASDCLAQVSTKLIELEQEGAQKFRAMPALVQDALSRYEEAARSGGRLPGISTGHFQLDEQTGGMCPGDLWVIGGGTSDGKSAFAEGIIHAAVKADQPTSLHTFEMSDDKTTDRFFSIDSQVSNSAFRRGTFKQEDMRTLTRTAERLRQYPLYIRDVSGMKLSALLADMRLLKRRHGVKLFVVDYGQLVRPDKKGHTRESEVAEMSGALKGAAKSLHATIIVLSQLNDDGKLRESRAIGMDADTVLTLSVPPKPTDKAAKKDEPQKDESRRVLFVGKNRDGERGKTITFRFNGPTYTFTEEQPKA